MTLRAFPVLALAVVALAAVDTAGAQASEAASICCRTAGLAFASDAEYTRRAAATGIQSPKCREAVILAAYVPPHGRGERLPDSAGPGVPEPGNWARLLAVLLGAISIARRRMS